MHPLTPLLRALPLLPTSGAILLALTVVQPEDALAQECSLDPFGAEVCLPSLEPTPPPTPTPSEPPPPIFDWPCPPEICVPIFHTPPPERPFIPEEPDPEPEPEPSPEPTPEPTPLPTLPPAEPIRPLWLKSDALEAATAEAYLEEKLHQHYLAQASQPSVDFGEAPVIVFDGVRYVELLEPNTAMLAGNTEEPRLNVWVRGFGGSHSNGAGRGRYADSDGGGVQLGFDLPLSQQTRLGLMGNYATVDNRDGHRGSWDIDSWGGGLYLQHWADNVFLSGGIGAAGFSGEHRRRVDGDTARGDRSGNIWSGMVMASAPFDSGDWILEPQVQLRYSNTSYDKFNETGVDRDRRLRYHAMEVDGFGSELSMRFAHPIRDGERSLFMPSLRLGWVADWGTSGDDTKVTVIGSGQTYRYAHNSGDDHGALVELGLDYTTYNFTDTSMGVYARGKGVFWGGDRGTSWSVSGGLNFRF